MCSADGGGTMLNAILHGKKLGTGLERIRLSENFSGTEDTLTSTVFERLLYLLDEILIAIIFDPSIWTGTVNLGGAWRADLGRVGNRNELASHQVPLCRLSFPAGGDQPRCLAVFPLPAQLAHGRGDAGRARHYREPRERAAVGAQVRPGLRQPDPAASAGGRRQMAFGRGRDQD